MSVISLLSGLLSTGYSTAFVAGKVAREAEREGTRIWAEQEKAKEIKETTNLELEKHYFEMMDDPASREYLWNLVEEAKKNEHPAYLEHKNEKWWQELPKTHYFLDGEEPGKRSCKNVHRNKMCIMLMELEGYYPSWYAEIEADIKKCKRLGYQHI